jgi:hypothetical protein
MKNKTKTPGLIAIIAIITLLLAACDNEPDHEHDFSGAWQKDATYHWKVCPVDNTIGQKAAHSPANGICSTCGYDNTPTPTAADFNIVYEQQQAIGNITVSITPKQGKTSGAITVLYNGSAALPLKSGAYTVTFNAAAASGWKAANGLSAGTLSVIDGVFNGIDDFATWLSEQADNNKDTPYRVALNVDDLGAGASTAGSWTSVQGSVGKALYTYPDKYISLDLSGSTVTSIVDRAFYNCSSLTSVTIPNSVISIGTYAFNSCSSLTSVTIPNSVTSIGTYTFYNCRSLTSVTIGNSVTSIGDSAFRSCSSLTSVTIPNSVTSSIGTYTFFGCTSLTGVTIGNSVTSIGDSAFYGCTSLTGVTIPNSVTSIGTSAFYGCTSLTNITIGNSVTSIGSYAFNDCTSLTGITIPNSVTIIGDRAFYQCSSLTGVTIPNSVTSIGTYAFNSCSSLTGVTIGNSVTIIGNNAFNGCTSLTSVTFAGTIPATGFGATTPFPGNLRTMFYATDAVNGTPGTYTRTLPTTVWTKE